MSELKVYEDKGGPAFPFTTNPDHEAESHTFFGMSLLDYFAAKAMPDAIEQERKSPTLFAAGAYVYSEEGAAKRAYRMATAMLKARQT